MKFLACILLVFAVLPVTATPESTVSVRTFFLEGVRSGRLHGPFLFTTGTILNLETGTFRLDVLSAAGSFILTEERTGTVFGVYELVPGRMIDAGYQLFTITRLAATRLPPGHPPTRPPATTDHLRTRQTPAGLPFGDHLYRAEIVVDLVNQIAYEWKVDGQDGGSAKFMERRGATLLLSRGIVSLKAGLLADADWEETLDDRAGRFEQGTLSNGTGWIAGIDLLIPVFFDGRWSASVGGGIHYQRESFDLEYGTWQDEPFIPPPSPDDPPDDTADDIPAAEPPATGQRFVRESRTAILSETLVKLTARIDYTGPSWFVFAGLRAIPWTDTDLRATIEIDNQRIPIALERRDPFSGFAGAGFIYQDVRSYVEFEAGGLNAIRFGVLLSF